LLRVPGFGVKTVNRILASRRQRNLRYEDIARLGASLKKARAFITAKGWTPGGLIDSANLRGLFTPPPEQLSLF
jgi:predicted DNA-binding helix-hairpin-helix protein